ncbi:MAG: sulfatase [Candidatus Wenzhouxiangella sp. M2_3B_020]
MRNPIPCRWIPAAFLACLLVGCGGGRDAQETAAPPEADASNLVLICIDTVRWDTWWIPERAGREDAFSPWGARSQVMAYAVSAAPWTVPSVGSILTGLYPAQHGGGLFSGEVANLDQEVPSAVSPAAPTLAGLLAEAGFSTGAVSAHPWFSANYGFERGFDELHQRSGAERVTARGMEWLDDNGADRFFLYLHYMDVHDPHLDLRGSRRTVESMSAERREMLRETAPAAACGEDPDSDMCMRYLSYADATLALREHLATVLDGMRQRGLLDDTVVVVYSDHGEEFHDHLEVSRARDEDPRGIHGFGHGQSLYQELLHVPLLIWHPDHDGREVARPVSLVDVVPSVMEWLGLELPADYEFPGVSFASAVEGADGGPFEWSENQLEWKRGSERPLFASGIAYGPEQMAVIDGTAKLIWHQVDNSREYYDLAEDPLERDPELDVPDRVADRLDADLDRYFEWFGSQDYLPPELSDEVVEKLKGVGYLQGVESGGDDGETEGDGREPDDP